MDAFFLVGFFLACFANVVWFILALWRSFLSSRCLFPDRGRASWRVAGEIEGAVGQNRVFKRLRLRQL